MCLHLSPPSAPVVRRRPIPESPSLRALRVAAVDAGLQVRTVRLGIAIRYEGRWRRLTWPRKDVPKSALARLDIRPPLRLVATTLLSRTSPNKAPVPGCVKPIAGARGEGFRVYRTLARFRTLQRMLRIGHVVQPLLTGVEYRATICRNGSFAVLAKEAAEDCTERFSRRVVRRLFEIVDSLGVPGAGFDVLLSNGHYHLLDVNLAPSLLIHRQVNPGRDLAPGYLWSALVS